MAIDNEHAAAVLLELFENGIKSDLITLIAGAGGQRLSIHRNILTANSKYFTVSLGTNFREANENEFVLDETDGLTLKAIVDFCYTGRIDLTEENVSKYLAIASSVELHLLESKCFQFISNKLDMNNAVETFVIADKYSHREVHQKSLDLICGLFEKLPQSQFDELDHRLLKEIMKSDAVYAEEHFIFERLLGWFGKDENERGQHMVKLLKLIRLPLIWAQYLNGDTIKMVYEKFDCAKLLNKEFRRRTVDPTANAGTRRHISVCCLFKRFEREAGAQHSAVLIGRYNSVLNVFEDIGSIVFGEREPVHFEAILHHNKVYILGGMVNDVIQKSVSAFDFTSGEEKVLPEMSTPRSRPRAASILVGKFIYVFGGFNNSGELNSCERFDLGTETWETLKPMSVARCGAAVAVLNGYIYVAGGYTLQLTKLNDVELYDPQIDEWISLSPMNDVRASFAFSTSNGYLYAMGKSSSIERFDSWKARWTKIDSPCKDIISSVAVTDNIFVIRSNGEFGEMKFVENGGSSFIPLGKSKFIASSGWRQCLFRN